MELWQGQDTNIMLFVDFDAGVQIHNPEKAWQIFRVEAWQCTQSHSLVKRTSPADWEYWLYASHRLHILGFLKITENTHIWMSCVWLWSHTANCFPLFLIGLLFPKCITNMHLFMSYIFVTELYTKSDICNHYHTLCEWSWLNYNVPPTYSTETV